MAIARERATAGGLEGIEFRVLDGEWIDLELASVDAVLCRWGYMLMADPAAALRETRRVLRPGGRVALAVWDRRERNPWSTVPTEVLVSFGLAEPPNPAEPGPYSMSDPDLVAEMLEEAGFTEIRIDALDVPRTAPDFDSLVGDAPRPVGRDADGVREGRRGADARDRGGDREALRRAHRRRRLARGPRAHARRHRGGVSAAPARARPRRADSLRP